MDAKVVIDTGGRISNGGLFEIAGKDFFFSGLLLAALNEFFPFFLRSFTSRANDNFGGNDFYKKKISLNFDKIFFRTSGSKNCLKKLW